MSKDTPFESQHTLFHPSSERLQLSAEEERTLKRSNAQVPSFLSKVPARKGMFRRYCEKSLSIEKQRLINFYNSKETV